MEKEPQLPTHSTIEQQQEEDEEEFYENMEAPKFVDLTLPDPFRPDDRYWFCLRVGCDQKHEEEIDPEAIYKDFVLRVMAARSPNLRLRKAMNGKNASTNIQCPLSAPAKSSKSRVTRLAVVPSISEKMVDPKGKVHPLVKPSSTRVAKTRQVAAKYMTTPRNKMHPQNPNPFLSVQNPKPATVELPANRVVAKSLIFHSPKKNSTEVHTPLRKICEGMSKLEIESQRKRILGYSCKLSKHNSNSNKSLPSDPSRKQPITCKDKPIQCMKSNIKGKLIQYESAGMDGDDKENALACMQETHKNNQKAVQELDKNFKDGTTEVKYRKPKPTNPKPFRLKTDERGILKEASLERKLHSIALHKEGTTNESVKQVQSLQHKESTAAGLKTSRGRVGTQIATITSKRTIKPLHQKPNSVVEYGVSKLLKS
ncbi:hypothetical protein LguiA_008741 [Lonicera macranthoides]